MTGIYGYLMERIRKCCTIIYNLMYVCAQVPSECVFFDSTKPTDTDGYFA